MAQEMRKLFIIMCLCYRMNIIHYNPPINFRVIITPTRVNICPLIVSVEEKRSAQEFQLFFSSVNMEGNQTRFNECSDSDIEKLVPLAFLPCLREV